MLHGDFDVLTAVVARGNDAAGGKHEEPPYRKWPEYALIMKDLEEAISRFWTTLEAKAAAISLAAAQESLQREEALAAKHWQVQQVVKASEERLKRLEEVLLVERGGTPTGAEAQTVPSFPHPQQQQQPKQHQSPSLVHRNLVETKIAATVASAFAEAAEETVMAEAGMVQPLRKAAIRTVHEAHSCMGEHGVSSSKCANGSSDAAMLSSSIQAATPRSSRDTGELSVIGRLLPIRALAKAPDSPVTAPCRQQRGADNQALANVLGKGACVPVEHAQHSVSDLI